MHLFFQPDQLVSEGSHALKAKLTNLLACLRLAGLFNYLLSCLLACFLACLVAWLVGWLVLLLACLLACLHGWLVGWLFPWLFGCLLACSLASSLACLLACTLAYFFLVCFASLFSFALPGWLARLARLNTRNSAKLVEFGWVSGVQLACTGLVFAWLVWFAWLAWFACQLCLAILRLTTKKRPAHRKII